MDLYVKKKKKKKRERERESSINSRSYDTMREITKKAEDRGVVVCVYVCTCGSIWHNFYFQTPTLLSKGFNERSIHMEFPV